MLSKVGIVHGFAFKLEFDIKEALNKSVKLPKVLA